MNRHLLTALGLSVVVLCSCAGGSGKKKPSKSLDEVSLGQRLNGKPDMNQRSQYEKYISNATDGRGKAGTQFQKEMFRSSTFQGKQAGGFDNSFKTKQSAVSRWKFWARDNSFSQAGKGSNIASKTFDAGGDSTASKAAPEGAMTFSGADNQFGTKSALTRSERVGRLPNIIETIDTTSTKNSSYTEDEVKRLMNRN